MPETEKPSRNVASVTDQEALDFHSQGRPGKLEITPTKAMATQRDLSLAYSPGVAVPVKAIADEVVVMKDGRVVEQGPKNEMFKPPHHAYTDLLLSSVPEMDPDWLTNLLAERGVDNIGDAAVDKM